jgi:hypothetical protein
LVTARLNSFNAQRKLVQATPPQELVAEFAEDEVPGPQDRAAVIMSTAILEQVLEDAIATHFFALDPEEIQK